MGLDLTAYRKLTPAPDAKVDSDGYPIDWKHYVRFSPVIINWTEATWPGRSKPVAPGVYSFGEQFGFRGGSYSGYNWWRDQLSIFALGMGARRVHQGAISEGPFLELIDFADNEGVIGTEVCAKLAKDFAEWQERADAYNPPTDQQWWHVAYSQWRKAFELAADGGAIEFH